ncbi:acetylornithine deacetylase [Methyloligella sp. GL2]|nr:acetylornithine deacetylase [Methyloligella sp. GL2]
MQTPPAPSELLAQLVAYDTTSAKSNLPLIGFVREYLEAHGVRSHLIPSEDGHKASLFATIGPEGVGGIGLSAHSDCVPVEGQTWTSDPFTLTLRDGKLYGRGACDMKGFLACVLASVPSFQSADLKEPIHILLSYDEEVGCVGVRPMIAKLGDTLPKPRAVIVGEPTSMQVIEAQKRIDLYRTVVTGLEGHSSAPDKGVNAIAYAAELVLELQRIAAEEAKVTHDDRFEPPYSTVGIGVIEGGTASNIIAKTCAVDWEVRSLPTADPNAIPSKLMAYAEERLLPRMRAVSEQCSIATEHDHAVIGFLAAADSDAVSLGLKLTGHNKPGTVAYATEAGLFEAAGCPTVVCGPGDIAQAHAADEFIAVSQLEGCMALLDRLKTTLSA